MKKIIRVVKEFEYEIEIDDKILNQEFVDAFESCFWDLEGDNLQEKLVNVFEIAAGQLANGEDRFIEGIGYCGSTFTAKYRKERGDDVVVVYNEIMNDIETEIVE